MHTTTLEYWSDIMYLPFSKLSINMSIHFKIQPFLCGKVAKTRNVNTILKKRTAK